MKNSTQVKTHTSTMKMLLIAGSSFIPMALGSSASWAAVETAPKPICTRSIAMSMPDTGSGVAYSSWTQTNAVTTIAFQPQASCRGCVVITGFTVAPISVLQQSATCTGTYRQGPPTGAVTGPPIVITKSTNYLKGPINPATAMLPAWVGPQTTGNVQNPKITRTVVQANNAKVYNGVSGTLGIKDMIAPTNATSTVNLLAAKNQCKAWGQTALLAPANTSNAATEGCANVVVSFTGL